MKTLLRLLSLSGLLMLSGCNSTPRLTGDTLVSVSWVNPTPVTLSQLETRICGSASSVFLETLPAYSEIAVPTLFTLSENCRVNTSLTAEKQKRSLDAVDLPTPVRKSPEREYNLRIQLRQDLPPEITLEPVRLTRVRLGS